MNTKVPKFNKKEYIYELPMPWPKGLPLSILEEIQVEDIDFSNRKIEFTIEANDYIGVEHALINDKLHAAVVQPKIPIDIENELKFKITAKVS